MGKMTTYIIMLSGIMLLFYFAGLLGDTPNSTLLTFLLSPEDYRTSAFWTQVVLVIELLAVGAIVVGFFTSKPELAIMTPVAIYLGNLFIDFLIVFNVVRSANPVLAILIFSPLLMLYGFTVLEFWRGRD